MLKLRNIFDKSQYSDYSNPMVKSKIGKNKHLTAKCYTFQRTMFYYKIRKY